jgi:nucleotide-binding universal stress UspA family protein
MPILIATDLSDAADSAGRAAARIAARMGTKLVMLHVAHLPGARPSMARGAFTLSEDELRRRRAALEVRASELRALGAEVEPELVEGLPDERIVERAREVRADLVVLGPDGEGARRTQLGATAARVIRASDVPVMIARDEAAFAGWSSGARPLRVLVGSDGSRVSKLALDWLDAWRRAGPIDALAIHVAPEPPDRGPRIAGDAPERFPDGTAVPRKIVPGLGKPAAHLIDAAASEGADLLVVGTHRRGPLERLRHGSTSLDIASEAHGNVLTVPLSPRTAARAAPGEIRRVLVPVDLGELSEPAVAWALGTLPRGGELELLHVVAPLHPAGRESDDGERRDLARRIESLVPPEARSRGLRVRTAILESFDASRSIVEEADRSDADLICLATRGRRRGLAHALLGSVSDAVVRESNVPVVVVPIRDA